VQFVSFFTDNQQCFFFWKFYFTATLIFAKCTVSVLGYVVITYVVVVTVYILRLTAVYIKVAQNLW